MALMHAICRGERACIREALRDAVSRANERANEAARQLLSEEEAAKQKREAVKQKKKEAAAAKKQAKNLSNTQALQAVAATASCTAAEPSQLQPAPVAQGPEEEGAGGAWQEVKQGKKPRALHGSLALQTAVPAATTVASCRAAYPRRRVASR